MTSTKRRRLLLGVLAICVVLVSGITLWHVQQSAQAAIVYPLTPGLVGWWRFDEGSGSIANDSSGNGNNGAINGASWTNGKYGDALSFDGGSVSFSKALGVTSVISISLWFNTSQTNVYPMMGFSDGSSLSAWSGYVYLSLVGEDWNPVYVNYATNTWNHLVVTFDGSTIVYYFNGVQVATRTYAYSVSNLNSMIYLGGFPSNYYVGGVDEVRIYNRALSAAEIQADFQTGVPSMLLAKITKGTTQVFTTLSWQGTGSINVTLISPSQTYTEDMMSEYQKTSYSTSSGISSMLNIKRLSIATSALTTDQDWNITLTLDNVSAYQISVETQK